MRPWFHLLSSQKEPKTTKETTKHKTRPNNSKPLSPITTHPPRPWEWGKTGERECVEKITCASNYFYLNITLQKKNPLENYVSD